MLAALQVSFSDNTDSDNCLTKTWADDTRKGMLPRVSRFFQPSPKSKRRRAATRRESRFGAGFKPRVELLELCRSVVRLDARFQRSATYSQNFDGLPTTGADQTPISTFSSSGPFDASSPIGGTTIDTGNNPQGLGVSSMAGWPIAEYSGQTLKAFISSSAPTTGGVYDFGTAGGTNLAGPVPRQAATRRKSA